MIRRAGYQDLYQIAGLIRHHYDETSFPQEVVYDEFVVITSLGGMLSDPATAIFVVVEGEEVVGVLCVQLVTTSFFTTDIAARELYFHMKPEYRGKSFGTRSLALAEEWARENGAKTLIIGNHPLSPPHVHETYLRHGYREAQTDYIKGL